MQVEAVVPPHPLICREPPPPPPPERSFEELLVGTVAHAAYDVDKRSASLDDIVKRAMKGDMSNAELLVLQVTANRYALELDLVSKIVQQAVQGLKEVLRTQV